MITKRLRPKYVRPAIDRYVRPAIDRYARPAIDRESRFSRWPNPRNIDSNSTLIGAEKVKSGTTVDFVSLMPEVLSLPNGGVSFEEGPSLSIDATAKSHLAKKYKKKK